MPLIEAAVEEWLGLFDDHLRAHPYLLGGRPTIGSSLGQDHGPAISKRCEGPFPFTGTLHEVVIQLPTRRSRDETATTASAEMSRQ